MEETVEKETDRDSQRQDGKPVLLEQGHPLVPVRETLMNNEFTEENITSDRAQPEGDWVKDQPENALFDLYFGPSFLLKERMD